MAYNYHQGEYHVKNWDKYTGTKNPMYKSSYELEFFKWCDRTPAVLSWGYENVKIPYFNPVKNRPARYFVDMYIVYRDKKGETKRCLVEIKPSSQTVPPNTNSGRSNKTLLTEVANWNTNKAKWDAATEFAKIRGWEFRIITERSIFRG